VAQGRWGNDNADRFRVNGSTDGLWIARYDRFMKRLAKN